MKDMSISVQISGGAAAQTWSLPYTVEDMSKSVQISGAIVIQVTPAHLWWNCELVVLTVPVTG